MKPTEHMYKTGKYNFLRSSTLSVKSFMGKFFSYLTLISNQKNTTHRFLWANVLSRLAVVKEASNDVSLGYLVKCTSSF